MTEPVIKMVGLANDDKPNAVADIFADEMMDRVAGNVQAAKDVIANSMFDQELDIEMPDEIEEPADEDVEVEGESEVIDEPEVDESETFEADQEILAEPDDQEQESEESDD